MFNVLTVCGRGNAGGACTCRIGRLGVAVHGQKVIPSVQHMGTCRMNCSRYWLKVGYISIGF